MKKIYYDILFAIWIGLIVLFLILIYAYNENKKEMVLIAEGQGYTCEKNIFGIYKKCYSEDYLNETGYEPVENWSAYYDEHYGEIEVGN